MERKTILELRGLRVAKFTQFGLIAFQMSVTFTLALVYQQSRHTVSSFYMYVLVMVRIAMTPTDSHFFKCLDHRESTIRRCGLFEEVCHFGSRL